jgi:hypothetical protein
MVGIFNKKEVMTKLYLDLDEIKERPNDMELGGYIRNKSFNMEKAMEKFKVKIDPNDKVAQIMNEWYAELGKNGCAVQPKASTILGTILAKYLNSGEEDVFDRYMNTKAGEHESFWQSLTNDEKAYVEKRRQEMRDEWYAQRGLSDSQDKRTLLKG